MPQSGDNGVFLDLSHINQGASLAVDANGGLHVTYQSLAQINGIYPVFYASCASNCLSRASWTLTNLGDRGPQADAGLYGTMGRLALGPTGALSVMWYRSTALGGGGTYVYATCSANCASSASWSFVDLASSPYTLPGSRFFALDPQGHPRYLRSVADINNSVYGIYYDTCDASCTVATNWTDTRISPDGYDGMFALSFDGQGRPRAARGPQAVGTSITQVIYAACEVTCTDGTNWSSTTFPATENIDDLALRVDPQGQPHLLLYPDTSQAAAYWSCAASCTAANGASWTGAGTGLPTGYVGRGVDLQFDGQQRPQLALGVRYQGATPLLALVYAYCTADCASAGPTWSTVVVDTTANLQNDWPVPDQPPCTGGWIGDGLAPSLGFDAAGNPRFAFGTEHFQGYTCYPGHDDIVLSRAALINQP